MTEQPTPAPRTVLMEIWRPLRYIGSRGPRCFWREHLPVGVIPAHPKYRQLPDGSREDFEVPAQVKWGLPSPWRPMDPAFARKALGMPGNSFTLDEHPGVTFIAAPCRKEALTADDWRQVRELRVGGA